MNNIYNRYENNPMLKIGCQIIDSFFIFFLLVIVTKLYPGAVWSIKYSLLGLSGIMVYLFSSEMTSVYQSWRGVSYQTETKRVAIAWFFAILTLLLLAYATKTTAEYSRIVVGVWLLLVLLILCFWRGCLRLCLRKYWASGYNNRNIAVLGANENGMQLATTIQNSPWLGLQFIGFFDDRAAVDNRRPWTGEIGGSIATLISEAHAGNIDIIYIALPLTAQPRIINVIDKLADTTTSVYLVPDFFVFRLFQGKWSNLDGIPIVNVFDTPFWGVDGWLKRFQDVLLTLIILVVVSIPMMLIAIAIKMTTPGSVLFKQHRYGIDGHEFDVWKFRTMYVTENDGNVKQAQKNDPRITKLGSFLRKSSLDELPQFFNVLQGTMSIVGPRPHAVSHNEEYRQLIRGYMHRHAVKPGITGWAQINGWRGETDTLDKMEKRIEYDLWYITHWSFWLDIRIILLTIIRGFSGKNVF